ncbi:uncharacterized protein LOC123671014 [Harmonia axyridis]|uniref:uncharacterized protein LOC123671014 n=1 Tax=Harmonia axyridis TaxID=115357 RepID=UPI001E276DF5|nr:uncharacterized protein LOC123671014 [Harmonia axyridis]
MALSLIIVEILVALLVVSAAMVFALYKYNFTYWRRKKVLHIPHPTIPFGNINDLVNQSESLAELVINTYNFIKSHNAKHGGLYFFGKPIWMPVDLDLLNHVMIKDFTHFVNHGFYVNAEHDPLSAHLFSLEDDNWRRMRAALTHTFTSGKIKMMFPIMIQNAQNLEKIIKKAEAAGEAVNVKDYISRFTIDVITSTAFGLEINSIENPDADFRKAGNRFFVDSGYEAFRNLLSFIIPRKFLDAIKFKLIKPDITEYFVNIVKKTIEYRENNNIERPDFIQLLIQLKNSGKVMNTGEETVKSKSVADKQMDMHLSVEEMAAQIFVFFLAGFETSATTATFALYEIALNEDIQNKLREEIRTVLKKHNGMTYEAFMEMNYLEQVIKETLRKYPPVPLAPRLCTKDYKVPGCNTVIEKDTLVMVPITGVQRDADIYPDPEKFDPERFGDGCSIPSMAFLSFGEGPRLCIGKRFGTLQTKVALATVLKNYQVTMNREKTEVPLQFAPKSLITTPKGDVWLNVKRIQLDLSMDNSFSPIQHAIVPVVICILISILIFFKWSFCYWSRQGIPCVPNPIIPFGNLITVVQQKETLFELTKKIYLDAKKIKLKHLGMYIFAKPIWIPVDSELIRNVLIKDSSHFMNHGMYINERDDPLTGNIFLLEDEKWKHTRAVTTKLFSPAKMKTILEFMLKSVQDIEEVLNKAVEENKSIDMKDYAQRFFMDITAAYAFGLQINTFKDPDCEFRKFGKKAIELDTYTSVKFLLSLVVPRKWLRAVRFTLNQADISEFFLNQVAETINYRSKHNIEGDDFLQFYMDLTDKGKQEICENGQMNFKLSLNEVAASVFTIFAAGFESSSSTTNYALLELALNQDIQEKARNEVKEVMKQNNETLSFKAISEMQYLEQVIKETLRKYPPGATLPRICTKDYQIPGTEQVIKKDTFVFVPVLGVHYDPELYPNPDKFDPDRFSPKNKHLLPNGLFLSFGEGARMCLGMRVGITQVKVILSTILKSHRVTFDRQKTPYPLQYSRKSMIATPQGNIWFHIEKA